MPKGSAPAGTTTSQTVNPTAAAQLPFLQDYWSGAQTAYQNNPQSYYPGQTLADFVPTNPMLTQGYQNLANTGASLDQSLRPLANQAWGNIAGGGAGYQNSPAYSGYQAYATGQSGPQQTFRDIGSNALNSPYPGAIAQYAPQVAGYGAQAAAPNVGTNALASQTSYQNPAVGQLLAQNPGTAALGQAAQGQGMGLNALANTASGAYLNSNPYLDAMYRAAADPVTRSYQTATAPTTDAAFSGGGRYGSGAAAGARDTNELNLGNSLANLSTNIYGQNYARERAAQDAAAGNYQTLINQAGSAYGQLSNQAAGTAGQLINQAATNYGTLSNQGLDTAIRGGTAAGGLQTAAGNQYLQGQQLGLSAAGADALSQQYGLSGLSNAFNTGNQAQLDAARAYPALASAQLIGPNAQIAAGQGLTNIDQTYRTYQQQQIDDTVKRYNANQMQPWSNLNLYGQALGAAVPGSHSDTSPYFQNQLASTLSGVTGAVGIGKDLFGSGGLLGGGGGGGGAGYSALANAGLDTFGGGGELGVAAASAAPALSAADYALPILGAPVGTIICTELVRQGRMPNRWRLAGMRTFAAYPEIARRGYYIWAIPSVHHLRRKPNSLYSRLLATTFCWRAEDIAARVGVKGTRKLWRGRAVTVAMVLPCLVCGVLCRPRDWRVVYQKAAIEG